MVKRNIITAAAVLLILCASGSAQPFRAGYAMRIDRSSGQYLMWVVDTAALRRNANEFFKPQMDSIRQVFLDRIKDSLDVLMTLTGRKLALGNISVTGASDSYVLTYTTSGGVSWAAAAGGVTASALKDSMNAIMTLTGNRKLNYANVQPGSDLQVLQTVSGAASWQDQATPATLLMWLPDRVNGWNLSSDSSQMNLNNMNWDTWWPLTYSFKPEKLAYVNLSGGETLTLTINMGQPTYIPVNNRIRLAFYGGGTGLKRVKLFYCPVSDPYLGRYGIEWGYAYVSDALWSGNSGAVFTVNGLFKR